MPMEYNPRREQPRAVAYGRSRAIPRSELDSSNEGFLASSIPRTSSRTFGAARYLLVDEVGDRTEGDGPDSDAEFSLNNYTDEDDDTKLLVQCSSCDFEIAVPPDCCVEIDPRDMICPVCDETLVDAINFAQTFNPQRRTLRSDRSSVPSGNPRVSENKVPSRGSRHEPEPDILLSPFIHNASDPTSSGVHPGEGSSSNTSDISSAKGSGTDAPADSGDQEDIEEKRLKASYIQELLLSTIFFE